MHMRATLWLPESLDYHQFTNRSMIGPSLGSAVAIKHNADRLHVWSCHLALAIRHVSRIIPPTVRRIAETTLLAAMPAALHMFARLVLVLRCRLLL